ncbi:cytoplasmic tyrosine-protein kinase BMX-like [Polypterus senegalus]|uniref:cytoplasmic tyrosine-protein kinase BMX-like n=1 Tax=Polypterus senegalus TaxID=55291 RepID=UPI0019638B62|nr:cytoplasmic tyrosine-protein kinase BMX-like [Polypterus senegalus]XP_039600985.1 cytoplasmic tyrosine-protein kinase BMX-like [Polypterus senegalus]XP_039600986.1 cytoplasmic tyrosine-protein kinase BMX-like [Polypterus senegalus]
MAETPIIEGILLKMSLQNRIIRRKICKERFFRLTETELSYFNVHKRKQGSKKGSILIERIRCVAAVNLEEPTPLERQYPFQVVYNEGILYLFAPDDASRREWLRALKHEIQNNSNLILKYHSGFWKKGKFLCCQQARKTAPGCTLWDEAQKDQKWSSTVRHHSPDQHKRNTSLPPVPSNKKVSLKAGVSGCEHAIPVNSFSICSEKVEDYEWYAGNLTRAKAETILKQGGKEGTFIVRDSSQPGTYTLSVLSLNIAKNGSVCHYRINVTPDKNYYVAENYVFDSIPKMIQYHSHNSGGMITRLRHSAIKKEKMVPFSAYGNWELNKKEISLLKELGSGQFGVVHLGLWKDQYEVAIKVIKEGSMSEDDFIEEAKIMMKLRHPKLVTLYGVCTKEFPIYIVAEYLSSGCLLNYLHDHGKDLQSNQLVEICADVCDGMAFLESKNFIHRDLAARNCLVDKCLTVKVSDFGMARYTMDDQYTSSVGTKFPVKWSSPEVLNYNKYSSKSDVWAFGILMWEVYSLGKQPYELFNNSQVAQKIMQGYRLYRPQLACEEIYKIMKSCWHEQAESRPMFQDLLETLQNLNED